MQIILLQVQTKSIALENNWLLKEGFATPNINAAKTSPIAQQLNLWLSVPIILADFIFFS